MYKFKRIFAIFLSVLLLSLTVGDAFISANDISRVYATGAEVVAGAAAADAIWEFALALLAATGLGGAAVANKDAIIDSYIDYLDAQIATDEYIIETKNPVFSMLSSVKCRNSQEINDFSTLSDTPFYPLFQSRKYLQCCSHSNPEGYRKSTVRPDNC